jgi:hypothetical protein
MIDEKSHAVTISSSNGSSEKSRLIGSSNTPLLTDQHNGPLSPTNGHSSGANEGKGNEWGGVIKRTKKAGELTGEETRAVGKVSRRVYARLVLRLSHNISEDFVNPIQMVNGSIICAEQLCRSSWWHVDHWGDFRIHGTYDYCCNISVTSHPCDWVLTSSTRVHVS